MKENYLVKVNTKASDASEEYVCPWCPLCEAPPCARRQGRGGGGSVGRGPGGEQEHGQ